MPLRRAALAALLGLLAAILFLPAPALAHATPVRATPPDLCPNREAAYLLDPDPRCASGQILDTPPQRVSLLFSEAIRPAGGGITVLGPSGQPVERGPATVNGDELSVDVDASAQGTYLVTWRVVSGDTHPVWGRYAFSVGHSSPLPGVDVTQAATISQIGSGLQALGHWLFEGGYALAFGTLAFIVFILNGVMLPQLWRLINGGILLLLVSEIPGLFGQMAGLGTGQFIAADLLTALLSSSYGLVLAQRLGAALLLWVLLGVVREGNGGRWLAVGLLPGLALATISGEASHAVGVEPLPLSLAANALHMAAMSVWVGGLAALLVVRRQGERADVVRRFGILAALALLALALSGTLMAAAHLASPADLLDSGYGRALALKLILLAVALGLAAGGQYARAVRRGRLRGFELIALAAVLLCAALLVTLPPPR